MSTTAMRTSRTALVLLVALLAAGCGAGAPDDAAVVRRDSAGVEIDTYDGPDRPLGLGLRREWAVGGEVGGPLSFYRVLPSSVGADSAGRLYVLGRSAVVVVGRGGRIVTTLGRAGSGPGELQGPASLAVSPAGSVAVFDFGRGGLVRWSPGGEVLPLQHAMLPPVANGGRHIALDHGLWVDTYGLRSDAGRTERLLHISGADTTTMATLGLGKSKMVMYAECHVGLNLPPLFQPWLLWDHRNGHTVVSAGSAYEVRALGPEGRELRLRRSLPARPATEALATAELGEGLTMHVGSESCRIDPTEMARKRRWAPVVPAIEHVTVSPRGQVWVQRYGVGDEAAPIDVWSAEGEYVGTLPAGTPFPVVFLGPARYAAVERDTATDVERLVVYGRPSGRTDSPFSSRAR